MRVVVQRVRQASVSVGGRIGVGLLVLAGFEETDAPADVDWMAGKLVKLRAFADDQGVMNRSGADMEVSLVNDGPVTIAIDSRAPE